METAATRNLCNILISAQFSGNGRYRVELPNGTTIFANLTAQTITINGNPVPWQNPFEATIPVNMSSTAALGFKGTGQVIVTATVQPNGTPTQVFSAGVGTTNLVTVSQNVTLTCPTITPCQVKIEATFTGNGRYRVILPNGTQIFANLNNQTVTINGVSVPWSNPLMAMITLNGSSTANLGFKGTGSVSVTATWPDGTVCTIFEAGVCLLYTSPSPRDATLSRMPSSA